MKRRHFLPLAAFLLLTSSHPADAQGNSSSTAEPTYSLHLPGGNDMLLTITEDKSNVHLTGVQKPGSKGPFAADIHVALDEHGRAVDASNKGRSFTGQTIDISVEVSEKQMTLSAPGAKGDSVVGAPVVTFLDLLTLLARRYDWQRGGPQKFVYLDPAMPQMMATMTAEAPAGTKPESITLDAKTDNKDEAPVTVSARRLELTLDAASLPASRKKTTLWFGPSGEALKGNMPLTGYPIRTNVIGAAAGVGEGEGFLTQYPDGIEPQGNARMTRVKRVGAGLAISYEGPANLIRSSVDTDAHLNPTKAVYHETWREMAATMTPGHVTWETPKRQHDMPLTGDPWFLPYYIATDVWEQRSPYSDLMAGQAVQVTYPTIEYGDLSAAVYRVERREDASVTGPDGKPATLHVWRVAFAPYFAADLWTDGRRLVKLASSAGPVITRDGWAEATKTLTAPEKPK